MKTTIRFVFILILTGLNHLTAQIDSTELPLDYRIWYGDSVILKYELSVNPLFTTTRREEGHVRLQIKMKQLNIADSAITIIDSMLIVKDLFKVTRKQSPVRFEIPWSSLSFPIQWTKPQDSCDLIVSAKIDLEESFYYEGGAMDTINNQVYSKIRVLERHPDLKVSINCDNFLSCWPEAIPERIPLDVEVVIDSAHLRQEKTDSLMHQSFDVTFFLLPDTTKPVYVHRVRFSDFKDRSFRFQTQLVPVSWQGNTASMQPQYLAIVDYQNRITERDENNNKATSECMLQQNLTNLTIAIDPEYRELWTISSQKQPSSTTFTITIKNEGGCDAGAFDISLSIPGTESLQKKLSGLKKGEQSSFQWGRFSSVNSGEFLIETRVDIKNTVRETNENDNMAQTQVRVRHEERPPAVPCDCPPDFKVAIRCQPCEIESDSRSVWGFVEKKSYDITLVVTNSSELTSDGAPFKLGLFENNIYQKYRVKPSRNGMIPAILPVATKTIAYRFKPGESKEYVMRWYARDGVRELWSFVDYNNEVDEVGDFNDIKRNGCTGDCETNCRCHEMNNDDFHAVKLIPSVKILSVNAKPLTLIDSFYYEEAPIIPMFFYQPMDMEGFCEPSALALEIRPNQKPATYDTVGIDTLLNRMKTCFPEAKISVWGFLDPKSDIEHNLKKEIDAKLSELRQEQGFNIQYKFSIDNQVKSKAARQGAWQRAQNARDYMIRELSIPADRITIDTAHDVLMTINFDPNHKSDAIELFENRRVEIHSDTKELFVPYRLPSNCEEGCKRYDSPWLVFRVNGMGGYESVSLNLEIRDKKGNVLVTKNKDMPLIKSKFVAEIEFPVDPDQLLLLDTTYYYTLTAVSACDNQDIQKGTFRVKHQKKGHEIYFAKVFQYDRPPLRPGDKATAVYFWDSDWISGYKLERIRTRLADPSARVSVDGRASYCGTREYNQALAKRRIADARDYLLTKQLAFKHSVAFPFGDENRFDCNHSIYAHLLDYETRESLSRLLSIDLGQAAKLSYYQLYQDSEKAFPWLRAMTRSVVIIIDYGND